MQVSTDNGPEQVFSVLFPVEWPNGASANTVVVSSEDSIDQDFNDTVVLFNWYHPPYLNSPPPPPAPVTLQNLPTGQAIRGFSPSKGAVNPSS